VEEKAQLRATELGQCGRNRKGEREKGWATNGGPRLEREERGKGQAGSYAGLTPGEERNKRARETGPSDQKREGRFFFSFLFFSKSFFFS